MDYTVLARRFRPQSFGEVVGQEHVAQALQNAIAAGRVAHAYLFTGARGVGKTSTARILAKSLNCPNQVNGNPCNECDTCRAISAGQDVDVLEIDGASNRSIDDIRSLRSNVNVRSMRSRYKIYIIDEVHMLTKEAFNALLKTLEEPPPNVKFIFCTTEPHKLPDTILSRCQRFDFGTIATDSIRGRLAEIAAAEGVNVEPEAIDLVARRAAGSMRDSQSLFDQLLSFGGEQVSTADVHRLLGTAPDDHLLGIVRSLVEGAPAEALSALQTTLSGGVQLGELVDQLIACLRDLMVLAVGSRQIELLSVSESQREKLSGLAQRWGLQAILGAMQTLDEARNRLRSLTQPRPVLELALVRASQMQSLELLSGVMAALRDPNLLKMGTARLAVPNSARRIVPVPSGDPIPPVHTGSPQGASPPTDQAQATISQTRQSTENTQTPSGSAPMLEKKNRQPDSASRDEDSINRELQARYGSEDGLDSSLCETDASQASDGTQLSSSREQISLDALINPDAWSQVIAALEGFTRSHVRNAARVAISGPNHLVLGFPASYHLGKEQFERSGQVRDVERLISQMVGDTIRITCELEKAEASRQAASRAPAAVETSNSVHIQDPFISQALQIFQAKYVRAESIARRVAESDAQPVVGTPVQSDDD